MKRSIKGFSLLEVLLVLAVMSAILVMTISYFQQRALTLQVDRTAMQMQQILTAGMSFYVAHGRWPANLQELVDNKYIPAESTHNAWQMPYGTYSTTSNFYIFGNTPGRDAATSKAYATMVAGKLPLSYIANASTATPAGCSAAICTPVGTVNIPGQNLNNATAVNFVGSYYHGGCVPVPKCPVDANGNTMVPKIFVVPASMVGIQYPSETTAYPIYGFTAYATGGTDLVPPGCKFDNNTTGASGGTTCFDRNTLGTPNADKYWRACLNVSTKKDNKLANTSDSSNPTIVKEAFKVIAFTRCEVIGEPTGSGFQFYAE